MSIERVFYWRECENSGSGSEFHIVSQMRQGGQEVEINEVQPHTGEPLFQAQCHTHDWCSNYRTTYEEAEIALVDHEDKEDELQ